MKRVKKLSKRKFYNGQDYTLDEDRQIVKLSADFHNTLLNSLGTFNGFKKFGGSSIGNVLETDAFKSKFQAFCFMSRLSMPVLQTKYIDAGVAIEPKVFELLQENFDKMHASDVKIGKVPANSKPTEVIHIEAEKVNYDYFKGKHDILGGVPDGLIPSKNIVVEVKTVQEKKKIDWDAPNNKIPLDYKKQAQLYAFLLGYDKYMIAAAFLKEDDYADPYNFPIKKRYFATYPFKVDKKMAEDDANVIIEFWKRYSQLGTSPKYNLVKDRDLVDYLRCHNEEEWKELFDRWKSLGKVDLDYEFN
ncbi:hypothetical protein NPA07_02705 [Mycoplasmopsis caviae]|uniref:YqaJ-like viral recombinase domain n=1 Tax=Mycoplasmopsis caviae TaxID=55603 RepID=A0A3P8MDZ0_9BACT|nr:hypothetical protein [Mycoplasmopsis caviae]UUD34709.1 hypothetical protein NPA07_02705 [Mycoplasmopsis caviae]VDR42410.1 Uncharacterised protein [Mycoplasmopsis caviae]